MLHEWLLLVAAIAADLLLPRLLGSWLEYAVLRLFAYGATRTGHQLLGLTPILQIANHETQSCCSQPTIPYVALFVIHLRPFALSGALLVA